MSGTETPAPSSGGLFSFLNIAGAPNSTILGILAAITGALHSMPGGAFPTNPVGWIGLGASLLMGLMGALAK